VLRSDVAYEQESAEARTRRLLATTQALFFFSLFVCLVIAHGHQAQTNGISFYGVYGPTMAVLIAGYVAAGVGLWRASNIFRFSDAPASVWIGLRFVALDLAVLLLTPYNQGTFLNWAHMVAGVAGALVQVAITVALVRVHRTSRALYGLCVQLLGGVFAAISLPDWRLDVLLAGQIIFQIGFGWCLMEWSTALHAQRAVLA